MNTYCKTFENIIDMLKFATNEGRNYPNEKVYVVYDEEFFDVFDESSFVDFAVDQADEVITDYCDEQNLIDFAKNFDETNIEDCTKILKIRNFDVVTI